MTGHDRPVVVGYDGSHGSRQALSWAVDEARRSRRPLRVVYALGWRVDGTAAPTGDLLVEAELRASAQRVADEATQQAARSAPDLDVADEVYVEVDARAALLEQSTTAELVVVGSRGLGGFAGLLLGSTSTRVAMHAHCPVVVVPGSTGAMTPGPSAGRVVVGVDGSERSMDALAFGFAAASARRVGLTAVHAWAAPWILAGEGLPLPEPRRSRFEDQEKLVLSQAMAGWADKYPDVEGARVVAEGDPAQALVAHSRGAELVVVGSRGRGGFTGLLLGSVSQTLVQHATCPVAVIHPHDHR